MTAFNLREGTRRKIQGMALAEMARLPLVEQARLLGFEVIDEKGSVTIDDIHKKAESAKIDLSGLGPAAGCVFRKGFSFTGNWKKSTRTSNHARMVKVWIRNPDS